MADHLRCLCGGHVYTLDELIAQADGDLADWAGYWPSIMGHGDLYCSEDDEVLTEEEVWRVRGLTVMVHDDPDPIEFPPFEGLTF